MFNFEQKGRYLRKNRKGFCRFWLEKNDDTDSFLRFLTEDISTRVVFDIQDATTHQKSFPFMTPNPPPPSRVLCTWRDHVTPKRIIKRIIFRPFLPPPGSNVLPKILPF